MSFCLATATSKISLLSIFRLESPGKMAVSSVPPMKLGSHSKPFQESVKTTDEQVPEFSNKSADQPDIEYMDSPMIDLSLLSASSSSQHKELRKLRSVLSSWGCLQLVNHGLSSSLLDKVRGASKGFFALPLDVKQHYKSFDWLEGYGVDKVSEGHWNDRLRLKVYPLDHRNFKLWPEILPNFRGTLEEYTMEVRRVVFAILKAIAVMLNLEEKIFLKECGGAEAIDMFTRFNYYPPCSSSDQVLGFKPHSDHTAVTILLQDRDVEGLQVEKDGQWFKVPIALNALFINVGDQLEIMSNGILKSVVHKVVVDKEKERTSVVMICAPRPNKEIGPLSELIDEERPQIYKKVKNYPALFLQYFHKGERSINAVKI